MPDTLTASLPTDEALPAERVRFTYSHPGQSRFRRAVIRGVERISGQPRLRDMYMGWAENPDPAESVFAAAVRLLQLDIRLAGVPLADVPREGGLLLVANHPFGIVDGLTIGHLGMQLRGQARILTNSLLCQSPEIRPHLLPVDFSGTAEARRISGETRRRAAEALAAGEAVAIFPGGGVATANKPLRGRAVDAEWHPFVGRLATIPGVTTLPLHFSGQNSRLFQIASHLSYPLRVALIFHETRRQIGRQVGVTLGQPMSAADLRAMAKGDVARHLRRITMTLAGPAGVDPDETYIWPRHVRW